MIWLKGLASAVISGVAGAVLAWVGNAATGTPFNWQALGMTALIAAMVGAAGYLKQSPIPKE